LRQQVLGVPTRKDDEYFISEEVVENTIVHNLRSEGTYDISVDADSFCKMVTCQEGDTQGTIAMLGWNTSSRDRLECSSTITKSMAKIPLFCYHYDPRYLHKTVNAHYQGRIAIRASRATDDLIMRCTGNCSHSRDHCRSTFVVGFTESYIKGHLLDRNAPVTMRVRVTGNCKHIKGVSYKWVSGIIRQEIIQEQSHTPNGRFNNPRPRDLFEDNNYTMNPSDRNALSGVRTMQQVYNIKREMVRNTQSAWGISGKCAITDLCEQIRKTRLEDRNGRILLNQLNPSGSTPDFGCLGIVRVMEFDFDADDSNNNLQDYKDSTDFKVILMTKNGAMLAHDMAVDGRATWVYDGSKSDIDFGTSIQEGSCNQQWKLWASSTFQIKNNVHPWHRSSAKTLVQY
jgi:hypothetical protein